MEMALSSLMHSHENINFQAYLKIHPFVISHDDILRIIGNSDECWNNSQGPHPRYRENKGIKISFYKENKGIKKSFLK